LLALCASGILAHLLSAFSAGRYGEKMVRSLGMAVLLAAVASLAFAGAVRSPEIDASSGAAALGLLGGGLLILRSRKKKA
jgi:hypothetical protein